MTTDDNGPDELFTAMRNDVAKLLRQELTQLRNELADSVRSGRNAAVLFGMAGLLGGLAAGASVAMVVRLFDRVLPKPVGAGLATALFGAGAALLARLALAEAQRAHRDLPARR